MGRAHRKYHRRRRLEREQVKRATAKLTGTGTGAEEVRWDKYGFRFDGFKPEKRTVIWWDESDWRGNYKCQRRSSDS